MVRIPLNVVLTVRERGGGGGGRETDREREGVAVASSRLELQLMKQLRIASELDLLSQLTRVSLVGHTL